MKKISIALSICMLLSVVLWAANVQDWTLVKDKNNIQVFTRPQAKNPSLKSAKGTVTINTTQEKILEFMQDYDNYPNWMHQCGEGKLLKQLSQTEKYVYTTIDAPWPVSDRDLITHVLVTKDENETITLKMTGVADYIPEKSSHVRIPSFSGMWQFQPVGSQQVNVIYQYSSDPGGSLSDWAANASVVDIPYNTLYNMRKQLEQ